jgi:hypothetical protein
VGREGKRDRGVKIKIRSSGAVNLYDFLGALSLELYWTWKELCIPSAIYALSLGRGRLKSSNFKEGANSRQSTVVRSLALSPPITNQHLEEPQDEYERVLSPWSTFDTGTFEFRSYTLPYHSQLSCSVAAS